MAEQLKHAIECVRAEADGEDHEEGPEEPVTPLNLENGERSARRSELGMMRSRFLTKGV